MHFKLEFILTTLASAFYMASASDSSFTRTISRTENKVDCQISYAATSVEPIPSTTITASAITTTDPATSYSLDRQPARRDFISYTTVTRYLPVYSVQVNTVKLPGTTTLSYIESVTANCTGTQTWFASYTENAEATGYFTIAPGSPILSQWHIQKRDLQSPLPPPPAINTALPTIASSPLENLFVVEEECHIQPIVHITTVVDIQTQTTASARAKRNLVFTKTTTAFTTLVSTVTKTSYAATASALAFYVKNKSACAVAIYNNQGHLDYTVCHYVIDATSTQQTSYCGVAYDYSCAGYSANTKSVPELGISFCCLIAQGYRYTDSNVVSKLDGTHDWHAQSSIFDHVTLNYNGWDDEFYFGDAQTFEGGQSLGDGPDPTVAAKCAALYPAEDPNTLQSFSILYRWSSGPSVGVTLTA